MFDSFDFFDCFNLYFFCVESPPAATGRLVEMGSYPTKAAAAVRKAKEASLAVHGAKLFNLLPRDIRDITTGTVEQFKAQLDSWLENVPDQPTIPNRQRAASSNSLIDQAVYAVV